MNLISRFIVALALCISFSAFSASQDEIVMKAYNAIQENHLTSIKGDCLAFDVDESNNNDVRVLVRESHQRPGCGGDAETSVKLFDIRISKADGRVYTNEGSDSDDYRELVSDNSKCDKINILVSRKKVAIPTNNSLYAVSDSKRAYFYSAPDEKCKINELFIVKGDFVNVYFQYRGFSSVTYMKKDGTPVSGWIHSKAIESSTSQADATLQKH